jgi:hypothetical protein
VDCGNPGFQWIKKEVLKLIAEGLTHKEMAEILKISVRTDRSGRPGKYLLEARPSFAL